MQNFNLKYLMSVLIAFCLGGACKFWNLPLPSPPILLGALMVLSMTVGYLVVDKYLENKK